MGKRIVRAIKWAIFNLYAIIRYKGNVQIKKTGTMKFMPEVSVSRGGKILAREHCSFGRRNKLAVVNDGQIEIGKNVAFGDGLLVVCHENVSIGNNCSIAPNVTIYDHDHNFDRNGILSGYKTKPVHVGEHVWIGTGTIILKGTEIGDNCVIGAGTVLQGKIPANSLVIGKREYTIKEIDR